MAENPACAINDAFGVRIGQSYTGRTRIGRVPISSSVVLSASAIQFVDGVAVTPGSTFSWFEAAGVRTLVVIQETDPLDSTLKNSVYLDWDIDLDLVPSLSSIFQIGHTLNGVAITHCINMPDADIFFATMFIGDQANGIWSFDPLDVVGTITKIITTEGSGVNPGRMGWDATNKKLLLVDARGADLTVFVYAANKDGTGIAKIGPTISTGTAIDQNTNCQISSNGRILYQSGNKAGSMDLDGSNQVHCSEISGTRKDLAPTEFDNEAYRFDGSADLFRITLTTCSTVEVLDAVSVSGVITDRANISESFAYWRFGKTIRRVKRDGTGEIEIFDGAPITNMQILIGFDEGRMWFVYDGGGETHIGSVTKAGGDFQDAGRIDVIAAINWAANCGTVSN